MRNTKGTPTEDGIGTIIRGRYRLEQQLAKGGMGTVFRATDTTLNRNVAVKVLHARRDDSDDPERLVERFRREAESLAKLNQVNIVTIFDYGETESGGYFLAMEFVDGRSLAQLATAEQLEPQRAINLVLQVAQALRYAHKHGIVHRDVKPPNILVSQTEEGETAKLVDFGLVRMQEDERLTAHGLILGSVHCMAPEQIRAADDVDARTDLYALGVVAYRLLTGQYPFNSDNPTAVMAAHLHAPVPPFRDVKPDLVVPPDLESIIRTCLEKEPELRFATAGELVDRLRQCLDVPPSDFVSVTIAREASLIKRLQPPPQTRSRATVPIALVLIGLCAALGGVGLVGGGLWVGLRSAQQRAALPAPDPVPISASPVPAPLPTSAAPDVEVAPIAAPSTVVEPAPEPAPTSGRPTPTPKPQPKPKPAHVAEPEPAPVTVAPVAPAPPTPAPAAILLQGVAVTPGASEVVVRLTMSNNKVRPLHFAVEGGDGTFPKKYQVTFAGGASTVGSSRVSVGTDLVDSVTIVESKGSVVVMVNSRTKPKMSMSGAGPEYVITVAR